MIYLYAYLTVSFAACMAAMLAGYRWNKARNRVDDTDSAGA